MIRRVRRWSALAAALLCGTFACSQDEIKVSSGQPTGSDYGRGALQSAVDEMNKTPDSPAAYRALAATVEQLTPQFTEAVANVAELRLAFLSLAPMDSVSSAPFSEQLEALATTVWPTAFELPPKPGEKPMDYVARACSSTMALQCKYIVPEYWGEVLSRYVWHAMRERAREAYEKCVSCQGLSQYEDALARFAKVEDELTARIAEAESSGKTSAWPVAGEHASPWSGAPTFSRDGGGTSRLDGAVVRSGAWVEAMKGARVDGGTVLGVYLRPGDRVRTLREIGKAAAAAGFRELALMARGGEFPYPKLEYRLDIAKRSKAKRVRVRDVETIQVLVQAVDATVDESVAALRF